MFVLPASVYPQPRIPRRKLALVTPKAAPGRDEDWDDTESDEPDSPRSAAAGPKAAKPGTAPRGQSPKAARPQSDAELQQAAGPANPRRPQAATVRGISSRVDLGRLRRKLLSPVRLVLSGVVLVVGLIAWWSWHLGALTEAERTIVSATRLGDLALKEHDVPEAARQYRQVQQALDLLGRNDPRARALRQTAFELAVAADLADASLFDILHEAVANRDDWTHTFRLKYRDKWVVIDAVVSRAIDAEDGRRYDVDFRLAEGPYRGVIIADLPAFDQAVASGTEPVRLIFAAQLDTCSVDLRDADTFRFVLQPATGFLWSNPQHLDLLGVDPDEETKLLLTEQTKRLGIEP